MRKQYMTICDRLFECSKNVPYVPDYFKSLADCYSKPSAEKIDAYESWCKWFSHCPYIVSFKCGIVKHNVYNFKIGAILEVAGGHFYLEITKSHNKIYCLDNPENEFQAAHPFECYCFPEDIVLHKEGE